jgi:hypothetical protein
MGTNFSQETIEELKAQIEVSQIFKQETKWN